MTKLPGAKPSPRIAGGVLRWYAGDTFSVTLALELRDQDGDPVTVGASDSLTVSFFDASHAASASTFPSRSSATDATAAEVSSERIVITGPAPPHRLRPRR